MMYTDYYSRNFNVTNKDFKEFYTFFFVQFVCFSSIPVLVLSSSVTLLQALSISSHKSRIILARFDI